MEQKGKYPQYQLSICSKYTPSLDKDYNNSKVEIGWELRTFNWEEDEVIKLTTTEGISCHQYSDGHKCIDSWKSSHCIMLDFDNGRMSKRNLLKLQKKWSFNSYIFSSQNHQKTNPPIDKLRVLIPLKTPITNDGYVRALKRYIMKMIEFSVIDHTCFDLHRYFAHGTDEVSSFIEGKGFFDWEKLNLKPIAKKKKSGTIRFSRKKNILIHPDTEVYDSYGIKHKIIDLEPDTPIFCPICGDSSERSNHTHNAVIMINEDGYPFLFCSSCKSREKGFDGVYNFDKTELFIHHADSEEKMIFIDTIKSKIYGGCVEPGNPDFIWRELTGDKYVKQFCKFHKIEYPEIIPRGRYELKFDSDKKYDFDQGYVNKYSAPDVLKAPVPDGHTAMLPDIIDDVINHVVNYDLEIKSQFYNDLAYFVQKRQKLITSYLFQGTEGTGKGFCFDHILKPIFGSNYCSQTDMSAFGKEFNTFLTDNVLVLVNEVSADFMSNAGQNNMIKEKIKQVITDVNIQIEGKGQDRINSKNVCSFLFATNKHNGVKLSKDDRRFNVAPRQEDKIHDQNWWTGYENMIKQINDELQEFVWYLKQFSVDMDQIGKVIDNEPKRLLQMLTMSKDEEFFDAFNRCDDEWFKNNITPAMYLCHDFKKIVKNMINDKAIKYSDLYELYNHILGEHIKSHEFSKISQQFIGKAKSVRIKNKGVIHGFKYETK